MKKVLILSSIVFIAAIMFLYLFKSADIINKSRNGFQRNISGRAISVEKAIPNNIGLTRIVGLRDSRVYYSVQGADYLISTDVNLNDPQKTFLDKKYARGVTYSLDSSHIYSYYVNENLVLVSDYNGRAQKNIVLKDQFSRILALTQDLFLIKDFKKVMEGVVFAGIKIDSSSNGQTRLKEVNLDSYKNNPFANDGLLMYDRDSTTIVYMNFYHNSYFVLDTSFLTVKRHRTIDTTTASNVLSKVIKSKNKTGITNYSPANVTNRFATINNGRIHILSNLVSDNQSMDQFSKSTTVDVYEVQSGKYLFSYILPDCNNAKVREIFLTDDMSVISVYPDSIVKYKLNPFQGLVQRY